jgi:hypothetical protein
MDGPKWRPGDDEGETVRAAIRDMETHFRWIEEIVMLLKREAEDIAPGIEADVNGSLAVRLNFIAHALELEIAALRKTSSRLRTPCQ